MGKDQFVVRVGSPEAEYQITHGSPVSSTPWDEVVGCVGLPEDVRGLRILDVGAGASDALWHLLSQGADAFAVDPKYNNYPLLKKSARASIERLRREGLVRESRQHGGALDNFFTSFANSKERYKSASATAMPFADDFFDIVYSVKAVSAYLDLDAITFARAIDECVRVTKPGGKIILYPFDVKPLPGNQGNMVAMRQQSHRYIGGHLYGKVSSANKISLHITRDDGGVSYAERLVIVK